MTRFSAAFIVFLGTCSALGAADCTPTQLIVAFTTDLRFIVVGFPVPVKVRVSDDCGNYISQGSVAATFSNGDPPLALTSLGNGLWAATYVLRNANAPFTLLVRAVSQPSLLAGIASVGVTPVRSVDYQVDTSENVPLAVAGGEPVHQKITITSSSGQVPFQVTSAIVAGRLDGLSVEPSSGFTPATVDLIFAPPVDLPGNAIYQAILQFGSFLALPFSLVVQSPPSPALSISKDKLLFSYVGSQTPQSQMLTVGNVSGLPLSFSITTDTSSGGPWLSVDNMAGLTTFRQPVSLSITADPTGLASGTYSGVVHVTAEDGTAKDVAVTMTVQGAQPAILLSQFGLTFNAIEHGATEPAQTFSILNGGSGTLNWSVSVPQPSAWLQISPGTGKSIAGSPDNPQITVKADAAGLAAGRYYALIQVDADNAVNGPQYLTAVLNVSPNTGQPVIYIRPSGVIATAPAGAPSVTLPSINVYDLSGGPVTFTSAAATFDSGQWLAYDPFACPSAPACPAGASPVRIDLAANSQDLAAGVHRAAITLQLADGSTRVLSVLLQLTAPSSASAQKVRGVAGDCSANSVTIQYTATSGYTVVAGWPATLEVQAFDNCNQPFTSGSIEASFSTGEPPVPLKHLQNGTWSQNWTPRRGTNTSVRLKFHATDPARGLDATLPYPVDIPKTDYDPPVLDESGIINPVSALHGAPLAPGSLFVLSGQRLASSTASAAAPYPLVLSNASIAIHGEFIPLSMASSDTLSGILPFDLPLNTSLPAVLSRGNSLSTPFLLTIATTVPSLYSTDGSGTGQGKVYHAASAGMLADPVNPAVAGESLIIECAGLGAVTPALGAGKASPAGASVIGNAQVTIGGIAATVRLAELKEGAVGVYRVQVTVPDRVPAGNAIPVQISVVERVSNQVTIAVQ